MPKIEFLFLPIAITIPSNITSKSTSFNPNTTGKNNSKLESSVNFTESTPTTYSTTWSSLTTLDTPWPSAAITSTIASIRPSESNSSYGNTIELERPTLSIEATTVASTVASSPYTSISSTSFTSKPKYRMWPTTTGGFREPEEIIHLLQNKSSLDEFVSIRCDQGDPMDTYHAELASNKSGLSFLITT